MINITTKPTQTSELFFGETDGISRLDLPYDSSFKKIAELDESNMWFLNVVSCSQDRWDEFPPEALSKFQKNLAYQTVLDSLVPDVFKYLSEISNDYYLKYLYMRISTMEEIHAGSYSAGVDQAFGAKASEFLDIIYTDPKIADRVSVELDVATRFIDAVKAGWQDTEANHKLLIEILIVIYFLEGIKFPFSFLTSWSLNKAYDNCAQGFSQLLIKISVDELTVHTTTGSTVLKKLSKSPKFKYLFESGWFEETYNKYSSLTETREIEWAKYLLEDGETPGFNLEIATHFIQYWIDRRRKEVGLQSITTIQKNDIEIWFDEYRNPNSKQSALQEINNISYQLGQVIDDLSKFDKE